MRIAAAAAVVVLWAWGPCGPEPSEAPETSAPPTASGSRDPDAQPTTDASPDSTAADVVDVAVEGDAGQYTFSVTVRSPDTGCERYANWWEVLDESGALVYRRILGHSHVDEQPFTRSGGPVPVDATDRVFVRAHMHPSGYGGALFHGSVADGLQPVTDPARQAAVLADPERTSAIEREAPLPQGCAF